MNEPDTQEQDLQDMRRLVSGHEEALNDLMTRHSEKLYHYLYRCLQNEDDAADLAQESFVKVYQNRIRFDTGQKFSTWLYTIASNLVKDRYRWRNRHPQVSLDAANEATGRNYGDALALEGGSPTDDLQASERAEAVRQAVAALPDELRQSFVLAEYEGLSHLEIGAILHCTAKAVETRIYRARQQLRASLVKFLEI